MARPVAFALFGGLGIVFKPLRHPLQRINIAAATGLKMREKVRVLNDAVGKRGEHYPVRTAIIIR